jgi:predicted RecA/RadA family phage recombinase
MNYTTASPLAQDTVVKVGPIVGIVQRGVTAADITAGRRATIIVQGVVEMPKAAPLVISQGDSLYWDAGASKVTTTAAGNTFCGHAWEDAASAATAVQVLLGYLT